VNGKIPFPILLARVTPISNLLVTRKDRTAEEKGKKEGTGKTRTDDKIKTGGMEREGKKNGTGCVPRFLFYKFRHCIE